MSRLPLGSGRGSCCCASGGLLSAQTTFPDARSIMTTVEMLRKLTTMWPSAVSATVLPWVHSARRSCKREGIGGGIEMLPAPPLPDHVALRRHLDEIVGVDLAVGLRAGQPAADLAGDVRGQGSQAQEEHVPVAEPARVVMVVGVAQLPENAAVPVDLEHRAALEARPRLEAAQVVHDLAAVEEVAVVEQIAVEAGPEGRPPRVGDLAVHVDQEDGAVAEHRREERVARLRARRVVSDEARPGTPDLLLVHQRHGALLEVHAHAAADHPRLADRDDTLARPADRVGLVEEIVDGQVRLEPLAEAS